jgi:hypothetical protein
VLNPATFCFIKVAVQSMTVRSHVFVCYGYQFYIVLRFWYLILKFFRQSGIFCFTFLLPLYAVMNVYFYRNIIGEWHEIITMRLQNLGILVASAVFPFNKRFWISIYQFISCQLNLYLATTCLMWPYFNVP